MRSTRKEMSEPSSCPRGGRQQDADSGPLIPGQTKSLLLQCTSQRLVYVLLCDDPLSAGLFTLAGLEKSGRRVIVLYNSFDLGQLILRSARRTVSSNRLKFQLTLGIRLLPLLQSSLLHVGRCED